MVDLSENETREKRIDPYLYNSNWKEEYIKREVNSIKSDFKIKKYELRKNAKDYTSDVEEFQMQVKEDPDLEYIKNSGLMKKMAKEGVTWEELFEIEKELKELNSSWTIENIQRREDFVLFLRNILNLKDLPDPQEMIKWEFEKLIVENNKEYNAEQIKFLRLLEKFFAYNKHLTPKDLTMHPLSDENPLDKFSPDELKEIIKKTEIIKIR